MLVMYQFSWILDELVAFCYKTSDFDLEYMVFDTYIIT